MLSLNKETCQNQLDILNKFCTEWGLEVNELKTKIIIFGKNKNYEIYNDSFKVQGKNIEIVDSYCYLGIDLHKSGSFQIAQTSLKIKAMRAFFGLKRTIIRSKLSFKALTTLFDSLIKPIILYGAPIWTPNSSINKSITKYCHSTPHNIQNFISKIKRTPSEKVQLSFLKWALGVHFKASNIGVWGESGRFPIIYQSIRLTLNYYKRLQEVPKNTFIHAALQEQMKLKLTWYRNIEPLLQLDEIYHKDHVSAYKTIMRSSTTSLGEERLVTNFTTLKDLLSLPKAIPLPSKKFRVENITNTIKKHFIQCWEHEKSNSSKLSFYHSQKVKFSRELYIDEVKGFSRRYNTTKLRISAHDLEVERGRYNDTPKELRLCSWCNTSMGVEIIENEHHLLFECDMYANLRSKLITRINSTSHMHNNEQIIFPLNLNTNNSMLKTNFMNLLSPNTAYETQQISTNNQNSLHRLIVNNKKKKYNPETEALIYQRSYIINCLSTFICHALEKRQKYVNNLKELERNQNTIVIHFRNST